MSDDKRKRWLIVASFAAVYIIWGSTYLAIRVGIQTIPGWLMIAIRFLIAGSIMFVIARLSGAKMPNLVGWRTAAIVGILLLVGGNGGVVWAEQKLPSGLTALIVAIVPLWVSVIDAVRPGGNPLTRRRILGLVLGMTGLVILIGPDQIAGTGHIDIVSVGVIMVGTFAWSFGTVYPRMKSARLPDSPLMSTAVEMLVSGVVLTIIALMTGQLQTFNPAAVSLNSWVALAYLIAFGSVVAFTAYVYLVSKVAPSRVATYAYVNPVVAVVLGAVLLSEPITVEILIAAPIIILGVVMINTSQPKAAVVAPEPSFIEMSARPIEAAVAEK